MRQQYHFRKSPNGFYAWDVGRLIRLARSLPVTRVDLRDIAELDEDYWFSGSAVEPTCRKIAEHFALMHDADLGHPIILCAGGRLMDGMHRVAKALFLGHPTIASVRFPETPPPDHTDVQPDELPY